jgi:TPR repeat protein
MNADRLDRLKKTPPEDRNELFKHEFDRLSDDARARFDWIRECALLNVRDALHAIVYAYQNGDGTEPDQVAAFEWTRKAALSGDESFYFELAMAYRDGNGTLRNLPEFYIWMNKAAANNDTEAMFQLADAHERSEFEQLSIEKSAEWTHKMAEEGAPSAMIRLARKYKHGEGVQKDLDKVLEWAQNAAETAAEKLAANVDSVNEDLPEAFLMLADLAEDRNDRNSAKAFYVKAAKEAAKAIQHALNEGVDCGQRLPEIMTKRLRFFMNTKGSIPKGQSTQYLKWLNDIKSAIDAAKFSDAYLPRCLSDVIYRLSHAHRDGIGTTKNRKKYIAYLQSASEAGHPDAAYELAMLRHKENDKVGFHQAMEVASIDNSMKSLIAQALGACNLPNAKYVKILTNLLDLWQKVEDIRQGRHLLRADECTSGIAHYTDGVALASMLGGTTETRKNLVRLYSIAYVNDPKEGKRLPSFELPGGGKNPLTEILATETANYSQIAWREKEFLVFIGCFSMECDNLDLWRFYGRNGTGFSVISPYSAFSTNASQGMIRGPWTRRPSAAPSLTLFKVLYDDESAKYALDQLAQPLQTLKKQISSIDQQFPGTSERIRRIISMIVSELLYLYKDKDYAHEREVRAIEARSLGDPNLQRQGSESNFSKLFIETPAFLFENPGSKVVVGPKANDALTTTIDIRHRLAKQGWSSCAVGSSDVAYR